ncbi:MAG TPA: hypothetical protein VGK93_11715 [Candidatus Eisenbacteria bacterium]
MDHATGLRAFALGERIVLGTPMPASRVTTAAGADITEHVSGKGTDFFFGQPGEELQVETTSGGGTHVSHDPLVITTKVKDGPPPTRAQRGAGVARASDAAVLSSTGVVVQAADGKGDWRSLPKHYPREDWDEAVLDAPAQGPVRLAFVGRHQLEFVGRSRFRPTPPRCIASACWWLDILDWATCRPRLQPLVEAPPR